jgi:hypothetical protein
VSHRKYCSTPFGEPFAVEEAGTQAADDARVVDDGEERRGYRLADAVLQERRVAEHGIAGEAAEDVAEKVGRRLRIEDHRDLAGLALARPQPA